MKTLENILEKIYQINQLAKSQKISEASFHKIIEVIIFWYKNRLKNYYPFVLMVIFIFFYLTMVFLEFYVLKN